MELILFGVVTLVVGFLQWTRVKQRMQALSFDPDLSETPDTVAATVDPERYFARVAGQGDLALSGGGATPYLVEGVMHGLHVRVEGDRDADDGLGFPEVSVTIRGLRPHVNWTRKDGFPKRLASGDARLDRLYAFQGHAYRWLPALTPDVRRQLVRVAALRLGANRGTVRSASKEEASHVLDDGGLDGLVRALATFNTLDDDAVFPALRGMAARDPDPNVRERALVVLGDAGASMPEARRAVLSLLPSDWSPRDVVLLARWEAWEALWTVVEAAYGPPQHPSRSPPPDTLHKAAALIREHRAYVPEAWDVWLAVMAQRSPEDVLIQRDLVDLVGDPRVPPDARYGALASAVSNLGDWDPRMQAAWLAQVVRAHDSRLVPALVRGFDGLSSPARLEEDGRWPVVASLLKAHARHWPPSHLGRIAPFLSEDAALEVLDLLARVGTTDEVAGLRDVEKGAASRKVRRAAGDVVAQIQARVTTQRGAVSLAELGGGEVSMTDDVAGRVSTAEEP